MPKDLYRVQFSENFKVNQRDHPFWVNTQNIICFYFRIFHSKYCYFGFEAYEFNESGLYIANWKRP